MFNFDLLLVSCVAPQRDSEAGLCFSSICM